MAGGIFWVIIAGCMGARLVVLLGIIGRGPPGMGTEGRLEYCWKGEIWASQKLSVLHLMITPMIMATR